jgi:hypothetical protein
VTESKKRMKFDPMYNSMPLRGEARRDHSPYIDARKLHAFVDDYLAGRNENGYVVWRIYTGSLGLDLFRPLA